MGTVWAAIHETLEQRVAVKIISQEHANSDELRRRFDTEARAAAKLRSRFVVGVYDNGITDHGLPYIVMEYLEGECLEDRIARRGSIDVAETARIARHVARALSKAHSRGIVHRDLKPANIFITKSDDEDDGDDWTAKVLDFGIAKMEDFGDRSTTKTGTVLGTPLFMSPEQVRGASDVDSRADLYSMGMVIYNMLTGTYAFEGQSFGDLLVSICTDPLPELSRAAPQAPPALNSWFQKACARNPDDRYQTAEELMKGLSDAIGDTSPATRLSISDITSTEHLVPLAETFAANSEVTRSGARAVDTGATAHTVVSVPEPKSSRLPMIVGGAALLVGALIAFLAMAPSRNSGPADATQSSVVASPPLAEPSPEPPSDQAELPSDTDDAQSETQDDPPEGSAAAPEPDALDEHEEPAPKTAVTKKPSPAPKWTPKTQTAAPAPQPTAAPAPKPKPTPKPAALDLGF